MRQGSDKKNHNLIWENAMNKAKYDRKIIKNIIRILKISTSSLLALNPEQQMFLSFQKIIELF